MEGVGGGRRGVVCEEVDDRLEAGLVAVVPAFATDSLDDDVHDVDRKVEVGLLLDEFTKTVNGGRLQWRLLYRSQYSQ